MAKLTVRSPEGTDDLVLVLDQHEDSRGRTWYRVRLPVRPNGTTGWVPATALSELQPVNTWLRISTKTLQGHAGQGRQAVFSAPIGVGQSQWPTPKGQFYIRAKLEGYGGAGSVYGPLAFITSATSPTLTDWPGGGIVGIHGTNQPGLIPGRISHGCVRMRNADILKLDEADAGRHAAHRSPDPLRGPEAVRRVDLALDPAQPRQVRAVVVRAASRGRGRRSWRRRRCRRARSARGRACTRGRAVGMRV